jgi:hypothetical protein
MMLMVIYQVGSELLPCTDYDPATYQGKFSLPESKAPFRALVVIAGSPEAWEGYNTGLSQWPFLYELVVPWTMSFNVVMDPASPYHWSYSSFLYYDTFREFKIKGDLNPFNEPYGGVVYLREDDDCNGYYGNFTEKVLTDLDPFINYNDYDQNHDGYVDYVIFLTYFDLGPGVGGRSGLGMRELKIQSYPKSRNEI